MQSCEYAHGWKETDYHIDIYKTRQCTDGIKCQYKDLDCPFWHTQTDRKVKKMELKNCEVFFNKIRKFYLRLLINKIKVNI